MHRMNGSVWRTGCFGGCQIGSSKSIMAKTTLVTFDIDGTLIRFGGESRKHPMAFLAALNKAFSLSVAEFPEAYLGKSTDGWTDSHLAAELLKRAGVSDSQETSSMFQREVQEIYRATAEPKFDLVPNVFEFLSSLQHERSVVLTIASGNFKEIALRKLELAGLSSFFDLECGGFGELHDRREMLNSALEACSSKYATAFANKIHIGDTLNDCESAKAEGFVPVIVTTGRKKDGFPDYAHVFHELPKSATEFFSSINI